MEKTSFITDLKKRAISNLYNQDEITPEALEVVWEEVSQMCEKKNVKKWAIADLSMIRLKIYLKMELEEGDEVLFKAALREINASPLLTTSTSTTFLYEAV